MNFYPDQSNILKHVPSSSGGGGGGGGYLATIAATTKTDPDWHELDIFQWEVEQGKSNGAKWMNVL